MRSVQSSVLIGIIVTFGTGWMDDYSDKRKLVLLAAQPELTFKELTHFDNALMMVFASRFYVPFFLTSTLLSFSTPFWVAYVMIGLLAVIHTVFMTTIRSDARDITFNKDLGKRMLSTMLSPFTKRFAQLALRRARSRTFQTE